MLRFRASAIRFRHISESMCFSVGPDTVGRAGLEPATLRHKCGDFPETVPWKTPTPSAEITLRGLLLFLGSCPRARGWFRADRVSIPPRHYYFP